MRERAPWYRRRLGALGRVAVALVVAAAIVGFAGPDNRTWFVLQATLVGAAVLVYLVGLVRSPD